MTGQFPQRVLTTAALLSWICAFTPAFAVNPDEMLQDPVLEQRARGLSAELRCLVGRNQRIDDSNAELAHDLRVLVRQRLTAGDTDRQVMYYVVARYGSFVLLKPPVEWDTAMLWAGPPLFLVLATLGAFAYIRRRAAVLPIVESPLPLSPEEQEQAEALLSEKGLS